MKIYIFPVGYQPAAAELFSMRNNIASVLIRVEALVMNIYGMRPIIIQAYL